MIHTIVDSQSKKRSGCGGRYMGNNPRAAAMKVFNKKCKSKLSDGSLHGRCSFDISVRETTAGSAKKVFTYHVNRVVDEHLVKYPGRTEPVRHRYRICAKSLNGKLAHKNRKFSCKKK